MLNRILECINGVQMKAADKLVKRIGEEAFLSDIASELPDKMDTISVIDASLSGNELSLSVVFSSAMSYGFKSKQYIFCDYFVEAPALLTKTEVLFTVLDMQYRGNYLYENIVDLARYVEHKPTVVFTPQVPSESIPTNTVLAWLADTASISGNVVRAPLAKLLPIVWSELYRREKHGKQNSAASS